MPPHKSANRAIRRIAFRTTQLMNDTSPEFIKTDDYKSDFILNSIILMGNGCVKSIHTWVGRRKKLMGCPRFFLKNTKLTFIRLHGNNRNKILVYRSIECYSNDWFSLSFGRHYLAAV